MFSRDFLEFLNYKIVSGPDRGPDLGRDLIALETRTGVGGETRVRWLVSCKHKAHSGRSIVVDDEKDILDRIKAHRCNGFIAVYSTLPSSSLTKKLDGLRKHEKFGFQVFDNEKIEGKLLRSGEGLQLAARYFPESYSQWAKENPKPAQLFSKHVYLRCLNCRKELLTPATRAEDVHHKATGIIVEWYGMTADGARLVKHFYWCCKGKCDFILKGKYREPDFHDGWNDILDLIIPKQYLRFVINQLHMGDKFSTSAFENMKEFLIALFPYVCREETTYEKERTKILFMLGGLVS